MKDSAVFVLSVFLSFSVFLIERAVGIGWDFHPDAITYTQKYHETVLSIFQRPYLVVNHFYYLVAYMFNGSLWALTSLNVFFYAITNIVMVRYYRNKYAKYTVSGFILFVVFVVFNPYRLHLSTHVLKDTFIIFFTVILFCKWNSIYRYIVILFLMFFRVAGIMYISAIVNFNKIKNLWLLVFFAAFFISFFGGYLFDFIDRQNATNMVFRDFDQIPTFQEYGWYGTFIRASVWPAITMTGTFSALSPALAYIAVSVGIIMSQIWSLISYRKLMFPYQIYFVLGFISMLAPGYTSFMRYSVPLIIIMPLMAIKERSR